MSRRRINRRAPDRFVNAPGLASTDVQGLWNGLVCAVVPMVSGPMSASNTGVGRELVRGLAPTLSSLSLVGEANGVAVSRTGTGGLSFGSSLAEQATFIPTAPPLSVFAFVVNRTNNSGVRHIVRSVGHTAGSWTFQMSYGAGQIGLTRWGIADQLSTTLGAVPNNGAASSIGMSHDGASLRLMLNGRFQSLASGGFNVATGNVLSQFATDLDSTSLHVVYLWTRALSDAEMLLLDRDPWAVVRPRRSVLGGVSSGLTGMSRVTQVVAEILAQPDPNLRLTQVVAEVLVPQVATPMRVTQAIAEVLVRQVSGTGRVRLTQALAEVLTLGSPSLRATQIVAEALVAADADLRLTQMVAEVLVASNPALRFTQVISEVLVSTAALTPTHTGQLFPRGSPPPF